jgi:hypothetical protein
MRVVDMPLGKLSVTPRIKRHFVEKYGQMSFARHV